MFRSVLDPANLDMLRYIVVHVFCPLKLPDGDDQNVLNDRALIRAVASAASLYCDHVGQFHILEWCSITRMLDNLRATLQFESLDRSQTITQLSSLDVGDVLVFRIQAQNAAVVFRKRKDFTIFESFEVSPKAESVMVTQGKLVCSYPGPAIEIPNIVFDDQCFLSELVNFLVHMNNDILDTTATTEKARSNAFESRDTAHPRYITELLTGILRSVGHPANIARISKRVGDNVAWNNSTLPWRRSPLWLLIRVALQTTLDRSALGSNTYKVFMLFFMCCLAEEKIHAGLPNDLLHFMSTKISRRLGKLGSSAPDWLSRVVLKTCTSLRSTLEARWRWVQTAQSLSPTWAPSELDLTGDVQLSLSTSGDFLRNALTNFGINLASTPFDPQHRPRGNLDGLLSSNGAIFEELYRVEPYIALYDVEWAVEEGIDGWVANRVTNNDKACVKLEVLADKYSSRALEMYENNPELLSVMLLTTIELWVALDKIAIREIPMLADYSPEIPTSILENLLLSKTASLHRLRYIHRYLSLRHSECQFSAFSPTITPDSFAVSFYKKSSRLQSLKARIEGDAQLEVCEKIAELERRNTHHAELQRTAAKLEHEFTVNQRGHEQHESRCNKCSLERELNSMKIAVHEWPLPDEQLLAEAVVFELDCPVSFNMWRTATFHILVDLCSPSAEPHFPYIELSGYAALLPYLVQHPRARITLASDAKPFAVTHYSKVSIPNTKERVRVKNGLKFYGYDGHACILTSPVPGGVDVSRYCTYILPSGSYQNLQKYVDSTSHLSNEVVANQIDCHKDLSIHEYVAFGHLRSGGLLQWLNILREIRGRSLTFRRHEVHFLLAQAVSQVGPFGDSEWAWHHEIQQPPFCYALLGELESLLRDVEANWLEGVTMDTISFLLRRLLASSPNHAVSLKALGLLRTARRKVFRWVQELSDKLAKTPGDEELRGFLWEATAICRSTFDVGPDMVQELIQSVEDVEFLVSSAILIHDHTPSKISSLPTYSKLLLDRDRRLSLVLESVLSNAIQADASDRGINLAIRKVWPDYRPRSKWTPLHSPNSRWFSCTTMPTGNQCSQLVHFNLLDGSLLVNGKPLGRLPKEIMRHPLYNVVFGEQLLEVIPSDLAGMDYATRAMISDHQVYFSLTGGNLVIRAKKAKPTQRKNRRQRAKRAKQTVFADAEVMELIPPERLKGDLPEVLLEGHAHWLNLSTSVTEIRPLDTLWETSPDNWSISCTPGKYHMQKGHESLVDIRSKSWNMVSALLRPLDIPQHLIISVSPIDPSHPSSTLRLSVALPRYGLSFYVDEDGDLQSHNMRGMVYDENQSVGTLFGLANRLVLRPKIKDFHVVELIPRCVLIPDGMISYRGDGHHARVTVNTYSHALERASYQTYKVDTDLGCLIGNVSLTNKLYCAYLHALTSGCGADPLTGRSGTEEALSLLRSAGCWSIIKFSPRDAELLGLIASLCPSRTWYPKHRKCMQTVEWLDLPVNSQHHELYLVCTAIKEHYEKVQPFLEGRLGDLFQNFPSRDDQLLERGARRAAYLFPSELCGDFSEEDVDIQYSARDLVEEGSREHRAYTAGTLIYHRTAEETTTKKILSMVESWTEAVSRDTSLSLRYDKSWLLPNLPLIWIKAYNLLRGNDEGKWFQLLFSIPAMAYASPELSDLVPVFVAFASHAPFRSEDPPPHGSYDISTDGYRPSSDTLHRYVSYCAKSFERSPESTEPAQIGESPKDSQKRRVKMYNDRRDSDANITVGQLLNAWPCKTLPRCTLNPKLYDVGTFTLNAQSCFSRCYHNVKLKEHLIRVQTILDGLHSWSLSTETPTLRYTFHPSSSAPLCAYSPLTVDQLLTRPAPSLRTINTGLPRYTTDVGSSSPFGSAQLQWLITTAEANAMNPFQHQYIISLRSSAECLGSERNISSGTTKRPTTKILVECYARCRDHYMKLLHDLKQHLGPKSRSEQALQQSGQWPRITAYALFQLLASNSPIVLSRNWKKCLVKFALVALELQRARRLLRLQLDNLPEELLKELENKGCDGWNAEANPDWLLIQLQGNFLVRRVQAKVADEMISPRSGENTAMQLNMGEGKSSVIVPIVVATLANGNQLVRVIVPKALTMQMFQTLVDRLGGLVNRRIYFLPFSRSIELTQERVAALRELMEECMDGGGILVVQPEHVLSLKLVSVEKQLPQDGDSQVARLLLEFQRWLHSYSRDILDESDEILHVRYQLVYTIGLQQHMEGSPERWTTTEQILSLVKRHASSLRDQFPLGIEYEPGPPGSFPHIRIFHSDVGQKLVLRIVDDIMDGLLSNFSCGQLSSCLKDAIRNFISAEDVPNVQVLLVKDYCQKILWGRLLLLRGLMANGILLFAFRERRWRVDYGLSPARTMLAVPYRAKDVPAQRAEFGHPDVAILLTCLSYYYGGLSEEQLRLSFEILLKQDDPFLEYDLWNRDCSAVPGSLKTLSGVNIRSSEQWKKFLFPLFSRNQATVDFYLSNVVFPKEAKEFPSRLSCSGWDLAEKKERVLTGFSGTNDGQYLLPLHITQRDPDHQAGTNAKVLSYLLQPENKHYMCVSHENGERRATHEFLEILVTQQPEIRVLLDVGAQMLDLQNYELAQAWLDTSPDTIAAAIYFNEDDELTVRMRDGTTQLLLSSPFAQQLDRCVVYLDDAHTRGTDIEFPIGFRAAVTLGPKVTKDRLAQGCMRMRKLGRGHSVMFFAPLEIDQRIRSLSNKGPLYAIKTTDILNWTIRETCDDIQQWAPHWAQQGMDHTSRYAAWTDFCKGQLVPEELSDNWLRPEVKQLEDLYGPHATSISASSVTPEIRERCDALGILSIRDVSMDEEQEREIIHEAERERHVERAPRVPPASHAIHDGVVSFLMTGTLPAGSSAFRPIFETLDATSAVFGEAHIWSPNILATMDFQKTVSSLGKMDEYLRPVQWVVSGKSPVGVLVVLSPYEVNHLMPFIRSSNNIHLHLYTPRITKSMKPCDDLALYSIPSVSDGWSASPLLMDQLNVFAGQLYLKDYETYMRLCRFLCVYSRGLQADEGIKVGSDGFIAPQDRPRYLQGAHTFQTTPMASLKALVSFRRKGMLFAQTHMGRLLDGGVLSRGDFDGADVVRRLFILDGLTRDLPANLVLTYQHPG